MYSHLSNNHGGWNKRVGVQKLQNQLDFFFQFLCQNKDLQLKITVRKIFIRFCKNIKSFVMKSINVQGGFLFCKRDVTFIREMRVISNHFVVFQVFVRKLFLAFSNSQSAMLSRLGKKNATFLHRWGLFCLHHISTNVCGKRQEKSFKL